jgi:hypothetical protein
MMATLAVSRIDAQDTKSASASPANAESKSEKTADQLIVGTWRGGASGTDLLVLENGGAYSWLFRAGGPSNPRGGASVGGFGFGNPRYFHISGTWKLEGDNLVINYVPAMSVLRGFNDHVQSGQGIVVQMPDQWPTDFSPGPAGMTAKMNIVRLDDALLRLTSIVTDEQGGAVAAPMAPKFFRRVDPMAATPKFAADAPKELDDVAHLARLNADEAHRLSQWLDDVNLELKAAKQSPLHLDVVDRGHSAWAGKLDFKELFHLTAEEATAYRDLMKLAGGFNAICVLSDQGQLTPVETKALDKLKKFRLEVDHVAAAIGRGMSASGFAPMSGGFAGGDGGAPTVGGSSDPAGANPRDQSYFEMLYKLQTLLIELDSWLSSTVYAG